MDQSPISPELSLDRVFGDPEFYIVPPGVIRYDHYHTHGWWARMQRQGESVRTFFSDNQYGSIDDALRAAIQHQQELIDAFGTSITVSKLKQLSIDPRERIFRRTDKAKGNGAPFEYWLARWYDKNHKIMSKRFGVKRYGEDEARTLALSATKANHNKSPKPARQADVFQYLKWKSYSRTEVLRLSRINAEQNSTRSQLDVGQVDVYAFEGERSFILHQQIERDRKLRAAKIFDFLKNNERVYCEICLFNFKSTYPFLDNDIIQVHHQTPLSALTMSTKTSLNDLMLICANCHFAIHQGDAVDNVIAALDVFHEEP